MFQRIFLATIFFISVFLFPWWLSASFGVVLAFRFNKFFELVFGGLFFDIFYGTGGIHPGAYHFTIGALLLLGLIEFLKTRLRLYP